MVPVIELEREDLEARREAILASLSVTRDEFSSFAATRSLSGSEWEAKEELEEIAFLLGSE